MQNPKSLIKHGVLWLLPVLLIAALILPLSVVLGALIQPNDPSSSELLAVESPPMPLLSGKEAGALYPDVAPTLVAPVVMAHRKSKRFYERGEASWYGTDFHGRLTATGEPYDMYNFTAAHRTLPLSTWILVKSLSNGKTVVVRVNDRGPFAKGRILDLSYAAAKKLGFVKQGAVRVEIKPLSPREVAMMTQRDNLPVLHKGNQRASLSSLTVSALW